MDDQDTGGMPLLGSYDDNNNNKKKYNTYEMKRSSSSIEHDIKIKSRKKTTISSEALGVGKIDIEKINANGINRVFWRRFTNILKVGYGSPLSRMAIETYIIFICLIGINFLNFYIITNGNAEVLPPLYTCKTNQFIVIVYKYTILIGANTIISSLVNYWGSNVRLRLRSTVTQKLHQKLFETPNVSNYLNNISREVDNIDQRVAADVEQATLMLWNCIFGDGNTNAGLLGPILNIVLSIDSLGKLETPSPAIYVIVYTLIVFILSIIFYPQVVKFTFQQQLLEGAFRFVHTRVKEFSESIVFYKGTSVEEESANSAFAMLYGNNKLLIKWTTFSVVAPIMSDTLTGWFQYVAIASQLTRIQIHSSNVTNATVPSKFSFHGEHGVPITYASLAVNVSLVGTALVGLTNFLLTCVNIPSAAGTTHRVGEIIEILDEIGDSMASQTTKSIQPTANSVGVQNLVCSTPDQSKVLFDNMTFEVKHREPMIVMGPSGSGKTSLLRVLGGLWPFEEGTLFKPDTIGRDGILFLPQRPYITLGTLRQQLIYPHRPDEQMMSDDELVNILKKMDLNHLLYFENGLDATKPWQDMLSGGEQQRVGFARLFYHQPRFCIMDESTSALDIELEDRCMGLCKEYDITVISVGHRPTLIKHHVNLLKLNGHGGSRIEKIKGE